ncbi:MAG: nucleotide exchange factor GrpE [Lachnospiraceae bacterium]|nr:nucleotide exchange factor GrpE [Lachnospiraceae bacterium]
MDIQEKVDEELAELENSAEACPQEAPEAKESQELQKLLLDTQEKYQAIEHFIKNQIALKDEQIDKLYKELEGYKQDAAERFVNQLMKAVIKVRRNLRKTIESDAWQSMSAEELRKEYTYVFEDLTDLLIEQNVDEYFTESGSRFDASIHMAKIETTTEQAHDKTIKQSLSEGYKKGDKVLIPERVIAYQYKEQ